MALPAIRAWDRLGVEFALERVQEEILVCRSLWLVACFSLVLLSACSFESTMDVRIELIVPGGGEAGTFTATGGAVDAGTICSSGKGSDLVVGEDTETAYVRDFVFTCDDASGTFTLRLVGGFDSDKLSRIVDTGELWEDAPWVVAGGTGAYDDLDGGGMRGMQVVEVGVAPWDGGDWREIFTGDVTSE